MGGRSLGVAESEPVLDAVTVNGAATLKGNATIGDATSDLIAFHGSTAVDQSAYGAASVSNAPVSLSAFGVFSSCAAVSNLIASVNAVVACLVEKGLMAST